MNLVEVEDLTVSFAPAAAPGTARPAVDGISLTVAAGECLALVGESGSGKSLTARALLGLAGARARVTARTLRVDGEDTTGFTPRDWRRLRGRGAGLVLQDALEALDPLRRVGAEVAEPVRLHTGLTRAQAAARAVELLREAGVPDAEARAAQYPHQLSGGLRQRALIASALAAEPRLVIADEPTTALDVLVQDQILRLLARVRDEGRGLLLISHDLAVVSRIADRVAVLADGRVAEEGPAATLLTAPGHPRTRALLDAVPARRPDRVGTARPEVVLEAEDVTKRYGGAAPAVDGVGFTLHAGETLGVVGGSGSGKSTLARIALGLIRPDRGTVRLCGEPWVPGPERGRRDRRGLLQLVSQNPSAAFDPRFTVSRIIGEALPGGPFGRYGLTAPGRRAARAERIAALLEEVGLDPAIARRRPHQLSGGQRQRVALARALAPEPRVLVCDEAVSALDVSVQAEVLELLARVQRESGVALLFITHDLGVVEQIADRVLIMKDGRVVESGDAVTVLDHPAHDYTKALLAAVPRLDARPLG
jgi:peptide/nickel transport system ATP-binding protein